VERVEEGQRRGARRHEDEARNSANGCCLVSLGCAHTRVPERKVYVISDFSEDDKRNWRLWRPLMRC